MALNPLLTKDRTLGLLIVGGHAPYRFLEKDRRLLEGIAGLVSVAIEKDHLYCEIQRKEEMRGELLQGILSIQEDERRRIAHELHDETTQVLASISANLEAALETLSGNPQKVREMIKRAQTLSIRILDETHRLIYELRPSLLDDLGLAAALRWLADNSLRPTGIHVSLRTSGKERRLASATEVTLFRVIQEATSNITRHARAKNVTIRLYFRNDSIRANIQDDGQGFDVGEAISTRDRPRGLGLLGMKERVELAKGKLNITSRSGGGTEIDIEIPDREVNNAKAESIDSR